MKKIIISLFVMLSLCLAAAAQNITVKGTVKDSHGEPLPGASVLVKGTNVGVVADFNGEYTLENVSEGAMLEAAFLGFVSKEAAARPVIDFVLEEDFNMLEETVVVGYGSIKKSSLSGAVASVKADDIPVAGDASVGTMLRGRAAGMDITNANAAPGSELNISIRGGLSGAKPLIVIDGVPQASALAETSGTTYNGSSKDQGLVSLNPNDIESIDILKDASAAAIYGSDASGGVILITTKRGASGKPQVDYSGSVSASWIKDAPAFLDARDYMIEQNKVFDELGRSSEKHYTQEQIDEFVGKGTNWMDEVTRTAVITEHNISARMGTDNTKVLFSASYYNHQGVVKNNDMNRITGRLNVDQNFGKKIKAGVNATFSQIKYNDVPQGDARQDQSAVLYSAMTFTPVVPVYDETGAFSTNPVRDIYPNPVSLLDVTDNTAQRNFNASAFIEYRPVEGLLIKATAGFDMKDLQKDQYIPTTTKLGYSTDGQASKKNGKSQLNLVNVIAQYNKVFAGKHDFSVMGGWEYKKSSWEGMGIVATQFPFDNALYNNMAASSQTSPDISSYKGSSEMASFMARLNYAFDGRYIITANLRVDGSSNFSVSHQWGVFPGVSAAWNMKNESWLKSVRNVSTLKIRAGAGQTGNAGSLTGINSYYGIMNGAFAPGGILVNGVAMSKIGNPNLKWETLTDYNIGIDFGFFNNRLNGSIDLYQRMREDVILSKSLMSYHELTTIDYNSGDVYRSRGIDLALHSVNIDSGKFFWSTDINFSFYRNATVRRDADWIPAGYEPTVQDWGDIYGWKTGGLINGQTYAHLPNSKDGCILYLDRNGYVYDDLENKLKDREGRYISSGEADGTLDEMDYTKLFNNTPIPFSINNTFRWGNWDANIYIYGSLNGWKINDVNYQSVYGIQDMTYGLNAIAAIKDRWSPSNPDGTMPGVYEANSGFDPQHSDFFYEKSWYLRLDNVSVGYTIPSKAFKDKVRSLRMYLSARNLFVLTPYGGMDPETGNGIGAYPNYASVSFGIDFKF
ncbi:MAG: SusC/RagA family TonB-linked outer membrane protein [Candidatus Cryptobacteroides sp.]